MSDVWLYGLYVRIILHTPMRCMHLFVTNGTFPHSFIPTSKKFIHVGLFTIWLYLMCASAGLTSWMDLEFHSYAHLEVYYIYFKSSNYPLTASQRSNFSMLFVYFSGSVISIWQSMVQLMNLVVAFRRFPI